jgi:hypothetical protein
VTDLSPGRLLAFAQGELRLLGPAFPRFFLAGGAFKTLLHRRPPRDLDLWAESPEDRALLLDALLRHGARPLPPSPGAERFLAGERLVEVSFQIETMEERLARFDLALSCCAVAFRGGTPSAFCHPLALASVERREVLLLRLAHPSLALATLSRARRYAADLGYAVPPSLEELAWSAFLAHPPEEQRVLIEKLHHHHGEETFGVAEEAHLRSRAACTLVWVAPPSAREGEGGRGG